MIDDRLRVRRRAEIRASRRNAADNARLGRRCKEVNDLFLVSNIGDAFREFRSEDRDIYRKRLLKEEPSAINRHYLGQVVGGPRIECD